MTLSALFWCSGLGGKPHPRQVGELGEEPVLEDRIHDLWRRLLLPHVLPVAAARQGGGIVAHREPALGSLPGVEIDRCYIGHHIALRCLG